MARHGQFHFKVVWLSRVEIAQDELHFAYRIPMVQVTLCNF
ncbi:Uncharacterised protein [Vibrio cholerae]|nr:Uncharacterised protein [Vibrio cholerae]